MRRRLYLLLKKGRTIRRSEATTDREGIISLRAKFIPLRKTSPARAAGGQRARRSFWIELPMSWKAVASAETSLTS